MIQYFNPDTAETLSRTELMKKLNMSIPNGREQVGSWHLLHDGTKPETAYGTYVTKGDIALDTDTGYYTQSYVLSAYPLSGLIANKLSELDEAFTDWRDDTATMVSSLGFEADADTQAFLNIQGLAALAEADASYTDTFMDADNNGHEVTAADTMTLRSEIVQARKDAYSQKWALREQINAAESASDLEAIEISFTSSIFGD